MSKQVSKTFLKVMKGLAKAVIAVAGVVLAICVIMWLAARILYRGSPFQFGFADIDVGKVVVVAVLMVLGWIWCGGLSSEEEERWYSTEIVITIKLAESNAASSQERAKIARIKRQLEAQLSEMKIGGIYEHSMGDREDSFVIFCSAPEEVEKLIHEVFAEAALKYSLSVRPKKRLLRIRRAKFRKMFPPGPPLP